MILYRGSLKSCDYSCSYCPFSKHRATAGELEQDKARWERFIASLLEKGRALDIHALLVAPYGEALIHPWYWEGLARLSAMEWIGAAGAQTNLSFSVEKSLKIFLEAGGRADKLRLWATFHPEMVSVAGFAAKCADIRQAGIAICAGAVGVPENLEVIRQLRNALPEEIYLWINKMDGCKRPYTIKEQEAFLEIDPYFSRELTYPPGDAAKCRGRLFVEGDGKMRACNISPVYEEDWYAWQGQVLTPKCNRRICSCYLAYGGRADLMNPILFGEHPLYRIPRRPKAVFFDIDGTLIPKGSSHIPAPTAAGLTALAKEGVYLLFATTLPYGEAMKRCREIWHLFSGGIFAAGAHLRLETEGKRKEEFCCMDAGILPFVKRSFRTLVYQNGERIYKITLLRPRRRPWKKQEADGIWQAVPEDCRGSLRYFLEGPCMQIVSKYADKAKGASTLCGWLGIPLSEAAASGDSGEDEAMLELFH